MNIIVTLKRGSGSLKLVPCAVSYSSSILTMAVSVAFCEMFSVKEWRDLANQVRGHLRSFKMGPCDRPYATFYKSAIVNIAPSCAIFALFDVK